MWKVDQKWKCIKLKSVQTLLKIACLAHRESYVVIICANSFKSWLQNKVGQVKVGSNIYQNRWFSRYEVICGHYLCQFMWKVDKKVKLKSIQILLKITSIVHRKSYLLIIYTNSYDNMHDSGDIAHYTLNYLNLTFKCHPRSNVIQGQILWGQLKYQIWLTLCVSYTLWP